jgi:hypothetical protein
VRGDLAAEPAEQVGPPLAQVDDQRGHPGGVEADPEHVDRGSEQRRVGLADEHGHGGVGVDQVPGPVHHHRRVRLVAGQDLAQGRPDRRHLRGVQGRLPEGGRVASGEQQMVALAQRHLELLAQPQQHVAAGPGPAGLQEAQVPGRDLRLEGEVELAEAAALAPLAQQLADGPRQRLGGGHGRTSPTVGGSR